MYKKPSKIKKYPISDHYNGSEFFNPGIKVRKNLIKVLKLYYQKPKIKNWPTWVENTKSPQLPSSLSYNQSAITYINHASHLIQIPNLNILTDPVYVKKTGPFNHFGPKRVRNPGIEFDALPYIHIVLITHNHFDHMDLDTLKKLKDKYNPLFMVPLGNGAYLQRKKIKAIIEMDWWKTHIFNDQQKITLVPAQHWSMRSFRDADKALWGGFWIESGPLKIYFSGDTGYGPLFKEIHAKLGSPDISLLPIGSYEPRWFMKEQHMNPEEAVLASLDLKSKLSIANHYGTFQLSYESFEAPLQDLKQAKLLHHIEDENFITPEVGETIFYDGARHVPGTTSTLQSVPGTTSTLQSVPGTMSMSVPGTSNGPPKCYLVGGAVRDKLLNLPVSERDWVVVGETEAEMLRRGFKKVGKDFPVFLDPTTKEEYALARTERKKGKGYYGFECHASPDVTLEQDLSRRDLTINAIAEDVELQEIIDPFKGQEDLKNKILRHVSRAFSEDPVRILRLARFAARFAPLGFFVAPETMELMRDMVKSNEVEELVPERVWQEMERALSEKDPSQFFLVLRECGALERIWPSLNKLWGVPQPELYHPEIDTGVHTMMALKMACTLSDDPKVRFAVVCHDLGKGVTPTSEWPSHKQHEERGVPLIQEFCDRYRIPKEYRDLAVLVSRYHLHCHKVKELKVTTLLDLLESLDVFRKPDRFKNFLLACKADARGRGGSFNEQEYDQANYLYQAYLAIKDVKVTEEILQTTDQNGEKIAQKLREKRVEALKNFIREII